MSSNSKRVLVIGAGMAGLAAAYRLKQAGVSVKVLERSATPGGRVRTVHRDGYIFDCGAETVTTGYTHYLSLLKECGLQDALVPTSNVIGTVRDGRIVHTNTASTWSVACTPLLSLRAKWQLFRGSKKVQAIAGDVDIGHMHRLARFDEDSRSTTELTESTFGKEVTEYLIDPMLRTIGGTGVAGSSWVDVLSTLTFANGASYCLREGLSQLSLHLASQLDIAYQSRVRNVTESNGRVTVTYEDKDGRSISEETDGCVLAATYESAAEIYQPLMEKSQEYRQGQSQIRVGKIHLGYKARTASNAYAIQVPTVEDPDVMLAFLDHNKWENRAPAGHSLVLVYFETNAADRLMDKSDAELTDWARTKAEKWFPELKGHFDQSLVTRWPAMAPASTPGYYARAARVLEQFSDDSPVQLACDMFSKTSLEAATTWGTRAARNLLSRFA